MKKLIPVFLLTFSLCQSMEFREKIIEKINHAMSDVLDSLNHAIKMRTDPTYNRLFWPPQPAYRLHSLELERLPFFRALEEKYEKNSYEGVYIQDILDLQINLIRKNKQIGATCDTQAFSIDAVVCIDIYNKIYKAHKNEYSNRIFIDKILPVLLVHNGCRAIERQPL